MMTRKEGGMSDITWTNERRKLSQLQPWPRNPRQIKRDQARRLAESFDTFGQVETIAISPDGEIYNGHQRLNVLMDKHGGDYEVEVRVSSRALSEKEREKLTVFLHRGSTGEWDFDTLANEFEVAELIEWGFTEKELQLGGFDLTQDTKDAEPQIDKAEELREKWGVELGQLWQLGEHRLICGDCTDKAVVERVRGEKSIALAFADPPYNAGVDEWDKNFVWSQDWLIDVAPIVVVTPGIVSIKRFMNLTAMPYVWSIGVRITNGRARSAVGFGNWIYAAVFARDSIYRQQQDFIEIDLIHGQDKDAAGHRGQKPLPFMEWIANLFSKKNDIVIDPFMGSGTTLIACENLGRKCRAVEISPAYCAVAIQRWVDLTGGVPELLK